MWFRQKQQKKEAVPTERGFYAFNVERAGDFVLYVETMYKCHKFIYLPGGDPFFMSIEDFDKAIKRGVLSFVEQLPEEIYQESLLLSCPTKDLKIVEHQHEKQETN